VHDNKSDQIVLSQSNHTLNNNNIQRFSETNFSWKSQKTELRRYPKTNRRAQPHL